jgi:hypothetical protein
MSQNHLPQLLASLNRIGRALIIGLVFLGTTSSPNLARMVASQNSFEKKQALIEEREQDLIRKRNLSNIYSIDPSLVNLVYTEIETHLHNSSDRVDEDEIWKLTRVLLGIIREESGGRPDALGDKGRALGLTQIWLTTAKQYGQVEAQDLFDPATNVHFALLHFSRLLQSYNGDVVMALYAWNYGESRLREITSQGQTPQNGYGERVLSTPLF